jgi:phenylacetate-CoA ligase
MAADGSRYLEPEIETAPRPALTGLQEERLRAQVQHAASASPFYRRKFAEAGVHPEQVRTLADLARLPFTTKD